MAGGLMGLSQETMRDAYNAGYYGQVAKLNMLDYERNSREQEYADQLAIQEIRRKKEQADQAVAEQNSIASLQSQIQDMGVTDPAQAYTLAYRVHGKSMTLEQVPAYVQARGSQPTQGATAQALGNVGQQAQVAMSGAMAGATANPTAGAMTDPSAIAAAGLSQKPAVVQAQNPFASQQASPPTVQQPAAPQVAPAAHAPAAAPFSAPSVGPTGSYFTAGQIASISKRVGIDPGVASSLLNFQPPKAPTSPTGLSYNPYNDPTQDPAKLMERKLAAGGEIDDDTWDRARLVMRDRQDVIGKMRLDQLFQRAAGMDPSKTSIQQADDMRAKILDATNTVVMSGNKGTLAAVATAYGPYLQAIDPDLAQRIAAQSGVPLSSGQQQPTTAGGVPVKSSLGAPPEAARAQRQTGLFGLPYRQDQQQHSQQAQTPQSSKEDWVRNMKASLNAQFAIIDKTSKSPEEAAQRRKALVQQANQQFRSVFGGAQ
jgi:hypothetical protein